MFVIVVAFVAIGSVLVPIAIGIVDIIVLIAVVIAVVCCCCVVNYLEKCGIIQRLTD